MNDKRIKEAENNVKLYIEEAMLTKISKREAIVHQVLTRNAEESLAVAQLLFKGNHSALWVIVTSYYSMYYIANAVLYKIGYKVGDKIPHKVTADSLIVFVRNKLKSALIEQYEEMQAAALASIKADSLIETFDFERNKRSDIQYTTTEQAKTSKAETSLIRAKEFNHEMNKLLNTMR